MVMMLSLFLYYWEKMDYNYLWVFGWFFGKKQAGWCRHLNSCFGKQPFVTLFLHFMDWAIELHDIRKNWHYNIFYYCNIYRTVKKRECHQIQAWWSGNVHFLTVDDKRSGSFEFSFYIIQQKSCSMITKIKHLLDYCTSCSVIIVHSM